MVNRFAYNLTNVAVELISRISKARVRLSTGKRMGVAGSEVFYSRIEGKGELSINVVVRADVAAAVPAAEKKKWTASSGI